jgi:ATP-dependent Zn protease
MKGRALRTKTETAHHEAGHAIASYILHVKFDRVHIIPDPQANLLGGICKQPESIRPDWLDQYELESRVIVKLAGMAAEARYTGKTDWRFGTDDFNFVFDVVAKLDHLADEDAPSYIEYLWVRAQNLLRRPGHWEAVQAVAEALLHKNELTYAEVRSIVKPFLIFRMNLLQRLTAEPSLTPGIEWFKKFILRRLTPAIDDPKLQAVIRRLYSTGFSMPAGNPSSLTHDILSDAESEQV